MAENYDIVIVGAGMVGATLASSLGGSNIRVAVLENRPPEMSWPENSVDIRVSAITAASQSVFMASGAWQHMLLRRVSPFREMHVWDAEGVGKVHFDSAEIGEHRLGHIIENRVIQTALIEAIQSFENIDLLYPASLSTLQVDDDRVVIELEDGTIIESRLIVGADGGQSKVRQLSNITTRGWPYQQTAVVATVTTEKSHGQTAWQRFLPTGPLAFLPLNIAPLNDRQCSIVWSTSPQQAEELITMDEVDFLDQLTRAFDNKLGCVEQVGKRACFPLKLQHVSHYVNERIALIGDAAHTVHPLAGQGVNLGIMDAAVLSEVLLGAYQKKIDIGRMSILRRYERWRKGENMMTMTVIDGFKRLFGTGVAPVRWLRNAGLNMTNIATPIKNQIMLHAMGLKGDLPKIARSSRI